MRYSILFALLCVIGAILFLYTVNNIDLVDWTKLNQYLAQQQIATQSDTTTTLADLYQRGQLVQYLRPPALVAFGSSIFMLICGGLGAIHIVLDKLFFKKFYEQPDVLLALRRGVFWGAVPNVLLYLALQAYGDLKTFGIIVLVAVGLEFLFSTIKLKLPKFLTKKHEPSVAN